MLKESYWDVEVTYVTGQEECFETEDGEKPSLEYDPATKLFYVDTGDSVVMIPREGILSIGIFEK